MARHVWRMRIREGMEEEYRRVHEHVDDALVAAMGEAGMRNYGLYVDGRDVISYFECDDLARLGAVMSAHPAKQAWDERNGHLLEPVDGRSQVVLTEVFHTP